MDDVLTLLASELQANIKEHLGPILDARSLRKTAHSGECTHVIGTSAEGILKTNVTLIERHFYEDFAEDLRKKGVMSPQLYASGHSESPIGHWILLEYLRDPFPRERWGNDLQQLTLLSRFHSATWRHQRPAVSHHYLPEWSEVTTDAAMDWFARSVDAANIKERLQEARFRYALLSTEDCCISGDANPTNWRMREDGELFLLDWERFGYGTPAFDLATVIPGNGTSDASLEQAVAHQYLQYWSDLELDFPYDERTFVKQILLAKLFTMVEFVANASLHPDRYSLDIVKFIVQRVPAQLQKIQL